VLATDRHLSCVWGRPPACLSCLGRPRTRWSLPGVASVLDVLAGVAARQTAAAVSAGVSGRWDRLCRVLRHLQTLSRRPSTAPHLVPEWRRSRGMHGIAMQPSNNPQCQCPPTLQTFVVPLIPPSTARAQRVCSRAPVAQQWTRGVRMRYPHLARGGRGSCPWRTMQAPRPVDTEGRPVWTPASWPGPWAHSASCSGHRRVLRRITRRMACGTLGHRCLVAATAIQAVAASLACPSIPNAAQAWRRQQV